METPKKKLDTEEIKQKITAKLPELLPKAIKWVVVHIAMLIYHISMPPWVTAMKAMRAVKSYKAKKSGAPEAAELAVQAAPAELPPQPSKLEQARSRRERLQERRRERNYR